MKFSGKTKPCEILSKSITLGRKKQNTTMNRFAEIEHELQRTIESLKASANSDVFDEEGMSSKDELGKNLSKELQHFESENMVSDPCVIKVQNVACSNNRDCKCF